MLIHTLWHDSDPGGGEMPWLADAVDKYTVESNGFPPEFEKKRKDPNCRRLDIVVSENAVRNLFQPAQVKGRIATPANQPERTRHEHVSASELSALCGRVSQCPQFSENFK